MIDVQAPAAITTVAASMNDFELSIPVTRPLSIRTDLISLFAINCTPRRRFDASSASVTFFDSRPANRLESEARNAARETLGQSSRVFTAYHSTENFCGLPIETATHLMFVIFSETDVERAGLIQLNVNPVSVCVHRRTRATNHDSHRRA